MPGWKGEGRRGQDDTTRGRFEVGGGGAGRVVPGWFDFDSPPILGNADEVIIVGEECSLLKQTIARAKRFLVRIHTHTHARTHAHTHTCTYTLIQQTRHIHVHTHSHSLCLTSTLTLSPFS